MSPLPIQSAVPLLQWTATAGSTVATAATGFAQRLATAFQSTASSPQSSASTPLPTAPAGANRSLDLAALRRQLQSLLQNFHGQLTSVLAQNGASAPEGFTLRQDELGDIRVDGAPVQRRGMEQAIAENPELVELFAAIMQTAATLRKAEGNPAEDDYAIRVNSSEARIAPTGAAQSL